MVNEVTLEEVGSPYLEFDDTPAKSKSGKPPRRELRSEERKRREEYYL